MLWFNKFQKILFDYEDLQQQTLTSPTCPRAGNLKIQPDGSFNSYNVDPSNSSTDYSFSDSSDDIFNDRSDGRFDDSREKKLWWQLQW